jgi:hypothetical protein
VSDRPSTRNIVIAWKSECGEWRRGDGGTKFQVMSPADLHESFQRLYKTLTQQGYTPEEIDSPHLSKMIVDICWREDKIRKMSNSEVRQAKKNMAEDWDQFIHGSEISGITIATLDENEKIIPVERPPYKKPEKTLEINPSDRIVMDTSDIVDAPLDLEFLKELGVDESDVDGNNE